MADSSGSGRPTGGKRRKYKSPAAQAAAPLQLPRMPDNLNGSSEDEVENEANGPHSTSTTPKSGRWLYPDECDRLMGINSVEPTSEEDRYGDGDLTDTEVHPHGVADDSGTPADSRSGIDLCPGAADSSRRIGSASLAEVLNRIVHFMITLGIRYPDVRSSWQHDAVLHVWMRENHDFTLRIQNPDVTRADSSKISLVAVGYMTPISQRQQRNNLGLPNPNWAHHTDSSMNRRCLWKLLISNEFHSLLWSHGAHT